MGAGISGIMNFAKTGDLKIIIPNKSGLDDY